jgi:hypothetical protein
MNIGMNRLISIQTIISLIRCTWVENPGEGVPVYFAKIPKGGQGFQEKMTGGVPLFLKILHGGGALICTKMWKLSHCEGGGLYLPSPPPSVYILFHNC